MKIDVIIKSRKTQKVLADESWEINSEKGETHSLINELLDLAATAPYHYKSHKYYTNREELNSSLPFRFYVLDTETCRQTSKYIAKQEINAGKIKNMLDAAEVLFIVTWLPEIDDLETLKNEENEAVPFEGSLKNMEHIAAASSAIQNVLIGATARNIPNYWSSGGCLRAKQLREHLGVSLEEILLGAVFLFPKNSEDRKAFIKLGALRNIGKKKSTWSKWINLNGGS